MIKKTENNILGYLWLIIVFCTCQNIHAQETIRFFPDRSYAVSGDTIWFSVHIQSENPESISEVVHVQLDNLTNNHISKVSVRCEQNTATGYIHIPDSLSTGIYLLKPFTFAQKNLETVIIRQYPISVYNRFEDQIGIVDYPQNLNLVKYFDADDVVISTEKERYEKAEEVNVKVTIPDEMAQNISSVVTFARYADPLSDDFLTGWVPSEKTSEVKTNIDLVEKNGVLISGRVISEETGLPITHATVILSVPDTIPFFDYFISDATGAFYFYLRNATGNADLVIQALAENGERCSIELYPSFIETEPITSEIKVLRQNETEFAGNAIQAAYYNKIFKGFNILTEERFSMPMEFDYPFYGQPTKTFYPAEFIDLDNFQEIAREIFQGVRYRERDEETTIRLLDEGGGSVFNNEPLRLVDGIPVFDSEIFKPMGTQDIQKVDVVFYKRYFGDLAFHGIMSVYTTGQSLGWVNSVQGINHFEYSCLQPSKNFVFQNERRSINSHIPKLDAVLYRNVYEGSEGSEGSEGQYFSFYTSDVNGTIEISVILIDKNNQASYTRQYIEVE